MAEILRQIDAEIDRLRRVREIVSGLTMSARVKRILAQKKPAPVVVVTEPPRVIILPPKQRREYHRRPKIATEQPRALACAVPNTPVFVPRTSSPKPGPEPQRTEEFDPELLEAAVRQNIFGAQR